MPFDVVMTATARRDLTRIPPRIVSAIVEFVYGDLAASPQRVGTPLRGDFEGCLGARRGPYRILYRVRQAAGEVVIMRVDHRSDVYRPR